MTGDTFGGLTLDQIAAKYGIRLPAATPIDSGNPLYGGLTLEQVAAKYGIRLPETETADVGDVGGMVHRVVGRGDAGASIAHMAPEGGRDASA